MNRTPMALALRVACLLCCTLLLAYTDVTAPPPPAAAATPNTRGHAERTGSALAEGFTGLKSIVLTCDYDLAYGRCLVVGEGPLQVTFGVTVNAADVTKDGGTVGLCRVGANWEDPVFFQTARTPGTNTWTKTRALTWPGAGDVVPHEAGTYTFRGFVKWNDKKRTWANNTVTVKITNNARPLIEVASATAVNEGDDAGKAIDLRVTATDDGGEPTLTYHWSINSTPTGAAMPQFVGGANGTNAAKYLKARVFGTGQYTFRLRVCDGTHEVERDAPVPIVIGSVVGRVDVSPSTVTIDTGGTQQFVAAAADQFGHSMVPPAGFEWSLAPGSPGTLNVTGLYTAPAVAGTATVQAQAGGVTGTATVNVADPGAEYPTIQALTADPSVVTGKATVLTVMAIGNPLAYAWSCEHRPEGAEAPDREAFGGVPTKQRFVFKKAGAYTLRVTVNGVVSRDMTVQVKPIVAAITVTPTPRAMAPNEEQLFMAMCKDQFGDPVTTVPAWSSTPGTVVTAAGRFTPSGQTGTLAVRATVGAVSGTAVVSSGGTNGQLLSYVSPIDGSTQYYGLYVPPFDPPLGANERRPVILSGHGFSSTAVPKASFWGWQADYAKQHRMYYVQLYGRGNTFYDGLGDEDLFSVRDDLEARGYKTDRSRFYFEGASMGATGAYTLGTRYPHVIAGAAGVDGFADYRIWHEDYYSSRNAPNAIAPSRLANLEMASPKDTAVRAMWQRLRIHYNTDDDNVDPDNGRNLADALDILHQAANGQGADKTQGKYAHQEVSTSAGHTGMYGQKGVEMLNYITGHTMEVAPRVVKNKTNRLRYGELHWTRIDRVQTWNSFSTLDATVTEVQDVGDEWTTTIAVKVTNVLQYSLKLSAALVPHSGTLIVTTQIGDGEVQESYRDNGFVAGAHDIPIYATLEGGVITGWSDDDNLPSRLKKEGCEGPIGDAFTSKFIVIHGNDAASRDEALDFCAKWNEWMHADIAPIAAVDVAELGALADSNLVLFGTSDTNHLIAKAETFAEAAKRPPITVSDTEIKVGAAPALNAATHGVRYVFPNPANTSRLIVVNHRSMGYSKAKDFEALPWYWPDYVVINTAAPTPPACSGQTEVVDGNPVAKLYYLPDTYAVRADNTAMAGSFKVDWTLP